MDNIDFAITQDGSLGLYNKDVQDIYHSTYGAHWESCEKFIRVGRVTEFTNSHDEIKILDICYGIGYNTKVAIDEISKSGYCGKILIDAIEIDKKLILISPLLKKQKISNKINEKIIDHLLETNLLSVKEFITILSYKKIYKYINLQNLAYLIKIASKRRIKVLLDNKIIAFLHKIYYSYVAFSNKKHQKPSKKPSISLNFLNMDARKAVLKLETEYDYIFLDAFTPKILPTLWTYDFFRELYRLLNKNGMLITYSSSSAIRAAMVEAGFYIGKSIDSNNKILGTVATKRDDLIQCKLNEYELGLLKTTAGIYYRDEGLDTPNEKIIALRASELLTSKRTKTSRYKKDYEKL